MTTQFALTQPLRGALQITGPDRSRFLQGLVTNDTKHLDAGHGIWAAYLTPQGKYLFDFMLTETGESILLEGELTGLGELKDRLLKFRLRTKVEIDDVSAGFDVWQLWGDEVAAAFGLAAPGDAAVLSGGTVMLDPRLPGLGVRAVLPKDIGADLFRSRGFPEGDIMAWDRIRLQSGVPEGSQDLVRDKAIILEYGFDELHGVSFTKGCFLGQELTARTKHRALVKKRLLPVTFDGTAPPSGTLITQPDGKEAGEIRSGQDGIALALLRLEALRSGLDLSADGIKIKPTIPGWVKTPGDAAAP